MKRGDLLPKFLLGFAQLLRNRNLDDDEEMAATGTGSRQPAIAQSESLPHLGARRNLQMSFAFERWDFNFGPEGRLPRLECRLINQIVAFN